MRQAYGNMPYYLTAVRDGQPVGCLQLIHQRSLLFGSHACSIPYFDAAGVLALDSMIAGQLVRHAGQMLKPLNVQWVELRHERQIDDSLPSRTDKVTLRLTLPPTPEELWDSLKAKLRNQVRKPQQSGLTAQSGGAELVDDFFAVYSRNMRDLGSPQHSKRFFQIIADTFASVVRLYVVRQADRPVAASLTLANGQTICVPWAGSDWRISDLCGNMLLYWTMLEDSCRRGAKCFDFGRSTLDSGTYRFKKQWGAAEVQLYWHYLLPPGDVLPDLQPHSLKYRVAAAVWKRLPIPVARLLGPRIISRLS